LDVWRVLTTGNYLVEVLDYLMVVTMEKSTAEQMEVKLASMKAAS
jgi:hypothetical protein